MREKIKRKIFAVSDIHGYAGELKVALESAGFDPGDNEHLLLVLGDLFDRGQQNKETDSFLRSIKNKVLIRGNHEDILMDALTSGRVSGLQYNNGTLSTLFEFFPTYDGSEYLLATRRSDRITSERLVALIESMQDYFETDNYIFTHGWLPSTGEGVIGAYEYESCSAWHRARWMRWPSVYGSSEIPKGKTLVVGHTSARYGAGFESGRRMADTSIFFGDGMIAIDGSTDSTGRVNVLVVEDTFDAPREHTMPVDRRVLDEFARSERRALTALFDEKMKEIKVGDRVTLREEEGGASLSFRVVSHRVYHNLCDLEEDLSPELFGIDSFSESESLSLRLRAIYTFEQIADIGIAVFTFA